MPEIAKITALANCDVARIEGTNNLRYSLCRVCDLTLHNKGMEGIVCDGDRTRYDPTIFIPHSTRISLSAIERTARCLQK